MIVLNLEIFSFCLQGVALNFHVWQLCHCKISLTF